MNIVIGGQTLDVPQQDAEALIAKYAKPRELTDAALLMPRDPGFSEDSVRSRVGSR